MNIKNYGLCNVRKHRDIKGGDMYVTLDISLKFGSLEKTIITSSEPKYILGGSGKWLITSMVLNSKSIPKK